MGKDTSKEVRYRRRHKGLDHVPKEDTHHGFKERMPAEVPQGGSSGPAVCMVFDFQSDRSESLVLDSANYSKASNWPIEDQHSPDSRRRSRRSASTQSLVDEPEISTSNRRRQTSKRTSKRRDFRGSNWGLMGTIEPNLGGNSVWQNDMYFSNPPAQQQVTHLGMGFEAPHLYATQSQFAEPGEELLPLTVVEDKKDHQIRYGYTGDLPNASQFGQLFLPCSHVPWSLPLQFDPILPVNQSISSGGRPLPYSENQFSQLPSQNTPPQIEQQQIPHGFNIYDPIWLTPATYPSSQTSHSYHGDGGYNV